MYTESIKYKIISKSPIGIAVIGVIKDGTVTLITARYTKHGKSLS
jgi:hypothetical protein